MSIDVLRCPSCGMRYNASNYQQCPYCTKEGIIQNKKPETNGKKSFLGFGRKKETVSAEPSGMSDNLQAQNSQYSMPQQMQQNHQMQQPQQPQQNHQMQSSGIQPTMPLHNDGRGEIGQTYAEIPSKSVQNDPSIQEIPKTMPLSAVQGGVTTLRRGGSRVMTEDPPQTIDSIPETMPEPNSFISHNTEPKAETNNIDDSYPEVQKENREMDSVQNRIQSISKTTAKYISVSNKGEVTYPVVGWLICVKGVYYGKSFPLRTGKNRVGRSVDMEVPMLRDDSVSSKCVITIIYDSRGNAFTAVSGESSSLSYVNGEPLYDRIKLEGYEEIELGDSEMNKFIFLPLCGEQFQWSKYPSGE